MNKRRESQRRYNQKTYRMLIKISPNDPDTLKAWQEHRAKFNDNMEAFRDLLKVNKLKIGLVHPEPPKNYDLMP